MKKFKSLGILTLSASILLSGCAGMGKDQTIGTVAGAAGGAALGSLVGNGTGRTVAMVAGAGLGALAGSSLGKSMDNKNQQ